MIIIIIMVLQIGEGSFNDKGCRMNFSELVFHVSER